MNADDLKYILAEEGRYEDDYIMNEGIEAIDIDEMCEFSLAGGARRMSFAVDMSFAGKMTCQGGIRSAERFSVHDDDRVSWDTEFAECRQTFYTTPIADFDDIEPVSTDEDDKPPAKAVANDPCFGDYETPDDVKTRGGENYHINKQKTKPYSPKNERRQQREKRVKDIRIKESRIHKRAFVYDL